MWNIDLVATIVSFLPIDEMIKCRRVCELWKYGVHSDQFFWKRMYCDYYKIDQFYNHDDQQEFNHDRDGLVTHCWLEKLLEITLKIPKKQINSMDEVFDCKSVEKALKYQSFFDLQETDQYCCTDAVFSDSECGSFKFSKEISLSNVQEVSDHFLTVIIFDSLTLSGYTPNLLVDQLSIHLPYDTTTNVVKKIPLLTFLSCYLKLTKYRGNIIKLTKMVFSTDEYVFAAIGLNMESFPTMIHVGNVSEYDLLDKALSGLKDPFDTFQFSMGSSILLPSYFNAGGGWNDSANIEITIDKFDRKIVNVVRTRTRDYY